MGPIKKIIRFFLENDLLALASKIAIDQLHLLGPRIP